MQMIHGRNTGDGQMFSDLLNYRRVAYLQEHPVIEMDTLYGTAYWQIFAVCVRDTRDEDRFNLQEEPKDYDDFVDMLLRRSLFLSDLTVTGEDSLLLLTANAQREYGFNGAQLVIAARLLTDGAEDVTYRVNNRAVMPSVLSGTTTRTTRSTTTTTSVTTTLPTDAEDTTTATEDTTTATQESTSATTGEDTTATTTETTVPTEIPDDDTNGDNDDYIGN